MATAKKASGKVAKKADLKKSKKVKGVRTKKGRAWYMPSFFASSDGVDNFVTKDNPVLVKILEKFKAADENVVYEGNLVESLEKEGLKAQGKKTVKKLVKAALRNMFRAGVIGKERDRRREEKEAKKSAKASKKEGKSEKKESTKSKKEEDDDEDDEDEAPAPAKKKSILKKKK